MTVTDKILNEWSFRCHDGIVDLNDPKKLRILKEILDENGIDLGKARPKKIKEPELEPEKDTIDYYLWVLKNEANIKDQSVLDEIKEIYIRNNDESNFKNNFRKKEDVNQSNLDEIYNAFKAYIEVGSKKKGVGKGEYTVLLGLNKSKSGGTAEKDVLLGNKKFEVKELAGNEFRTGSGGSITNSTFQKNYNYLMELLSKKVDIKNLESESEIEKQIKILVSYFKKEYKTGNVSDGILDSIRKLIENEKNNLSKIDQFLADENVDADTNYVKIGNKKYEIDSQEIDENGNPISIKLKGEVKEEKATTIKLKKHPWIQNPDTLNTDFEEIWDTYLKDITGFIVYTGSKLTLYLPETIKQDFKPVRVVQNQINIKRK